ncbi:uncharacterized protein LOC119396141 isoform X2 [Rhipicephalus sanguineus]|uniref:uncharacterized protein LOC119396141 isoform X2 n=1 Tax=Rhipicephalus sanguineus TaxID=34632 RepID=UPI0018935D29|nr:uncharacterized protein LOC119396141 isoform X2 [Rhipicephalus sanguineus]
MFERFVYCLQHDDMRTTQSEFNRHFRIDETSGKLSVFPVDATHGSASAAIGDSVLASQPRAICKVSGKASEDSGMDTKSVAFALLCTLLAACAQPYDGGVLRAPRDFYEERPRGLDRGGGLEREFGSGLERESVGGYPGGYRDRGPERFPQSASGSYPGRRPAGLPSRDVYPGGLPGGTSPTLCGVFKHCKGKGTYRYTIECPSQKRNCK